MFSFSPCRARETVRCSGESLDLLFQRNDFRMVSAEDSMLDLENGAVGAFSLRVFSACGVERGQVLFHHGDFVVIWAEPFDPDVQGPLQSIMGVGVAALPDQQGAEYGEIACCCGRIQPKRHVA